MSVLTQALSPTCVQVGGWGSAEGYDLSWVSRARVNMACKAKRTLIKKVKSILKEQLPVLKDAKHEGMLLRLSTP